MQDPVGYINRELDGELIKHDLILIKNHSHSQSFLSIGGILNQDELVAFVQSELNINKEKALAIINATNRLYSETMERRFGTEKLADRIKRTNPFLLRIRGIKTVKQWAEYQVRGLLFSSEEEAVGHVLEFIAKTCHPNATTPEFDDDLDFQVSDGNTIKGFQIKMSWDCMPMSSRKNLSNTIKRLQQHYGESGKKFVGIFAPCYGKATTTSPKGQKYLSMRSRDLWLEVGGGKDPDYDVKIGAVCETLCSESRRKLIDEIVNPMIEGLTSSANDKIGDGRGDLDYKKLFRAVNK